MHSNEPDKNAAIGLPRTHAKPNKASPNEIKTGETVLRIG
jgi:hypothetical protein